MADNQQTPKKTLRELTQERFQEEVARELGVDLHNSGFPEREIQHLEQSLHADDEEASEP